MWKCVHFPRYTYDFNLTQCIKRFHRAMTRPFFTRERISDFDIYDKNCITTLQLARNRLAEGYSVEFQVASIFHGSTLILKNPGPSFSVHLRFGYGVLIWTRRWITVSEHSLSTIGGTFKQTFILQPSLYNICEGIHGRTKSYCCSLIFRWRLAFA